MYWACPREMSRTPSTRLREVKHYYAVLEDGLIFVSGWYTPAPTKEGPGGVRAVAGGACPHALRRHGARGPRSPTTTTPPAPTARGTSSSSKSGTTAGSTRSRTPTRPELVGTTRERIDASGFNYGEAFAAVTEEAGGEWVSYLFTHPETREDAPKHSWMVRRDNLLFGAGWYEGIK